MHCAFSLVKPGSAVPVCSAAALSRLILAFLAASCDAELLTRGVSAALNTSVKSLLRFLIATVLKSEATKTLV